MDQPMIIDSFAGGGGASTGIEIALGRSPDVAINHSAKALALHSANHPETLHLDSNIWDVDPLTVTKGQHVGLLWASPDCFPASTMILTDRGYRPIESIVEGDRVLTHAGRYRRVYATMRSQKVVRGIDIQGVPTITVSDEHPFFARAMHNVWDNANRRYKRSLNPAAWVLAKELRAGAAPMNAAGGDRHFCATPCTFEHIAIPEVGGRGIDLDERLMWLAGRYVGDGWSRLGDGRAELVITCGKIEADGLAEKLALWPRYGKRAASNQLAWHRRDTKTAHQFSTNHRGLVEWLRDQFGHGGAEKSFPAWALSAPPALRRALLAGYVSADGSEFSTRANRVTETVTISKALALSTKALAESLGFTATISQPRRNTVLIDGRTVNAKLTYMVRWREAPARSQTVRDGLHNWSRVQSVGEPGEMVEVFNISVEDDETYVADGIVVHNCKHFSKAKGGAPRDRNIRDLAWVVIRWAEFAKPDVICMENVEEFVTWGPVDNDGQPIKEFAGQTFELWINRLKKAGYRVQWRELRACDYGAPTIRKRWFLVARRDGRAITWPKPTHGDPKSPEVRKGKLLPWRTAAECIDWSLPCPSIFDTAPEIMARHGLRAVRPLAANTLARVARGMARYVIEAEQPFLVSLKGTERRDSATDAPHPTVLAGGGHSALIAPSITRFNSGATGQDLRDPLATVTANSWIKKPGGAAPLGMLAPYLASIAHGDSGGRREYPFTDPLGTVTVGGIQHAVIAPVLTYAQQGGGNRPAEAPHHTICASRKDQNSMIAAFLAQQNGGPRMGAHPGHDLRDPISTIAATGSHQTPVAVFFAKYYGTGDGARTDAPMHTITVKDRMAHMQAELAAPPFAPEHHARAREVAEFMRSHDAWDGGEFVTLEIDGATFVVIDIGMRMLTPRELFNAQGFPRWKKTWKVRAWPDPITHAVDAQEQHQGFSGLAKPVEKSSRPSSDAGQSEPVPVHALIDLGQRRLVLRKAGKSNFSAKDAGELGSFPLPIEIADIARSLAHSERNRDRVTPIGEVGQQASVRPSIRRRNGGLFATLCGDEMMPHAAGAGTATLIPNEDLRSTISLAGQRSRACDVILKILSCYAASAIASCTPGRTPTEPLYVAELTLDDSYVIEGVWEAGADGEPKWQAFAKDVQVSCCGNSVCPPLAAAIVGANCRHLATDQVRRTA